MIDHITVNSIVKRSPHLSFLKTNTMLLSLHGSRAYGTDVEGSDYDYKGIVVAPSEYNFGFLNEFEQAELSEPDTVIYENRKFFKMASDCNPNIMELLFCDESDIVYVNEFGRELLDNRELFLSKRARYSFSGYAVQQLKRLLLHRAYLLNPPKKMPLRSDFGLFERPDIPANQLNAAKAAINKELDRLNFKFLDHLENAERIEVRNCVVDLLNEFKIYHEERYIAMARKIGFDDNVIEILKNERSYDQAKKEWDNYQTWKKNRNEKRASDEAKFGYDCKHALHCTRLTRMAKEILLTGKVNVKREDRKELLAIRRGEWTFDQVIEHAQAIEDELPELYEKSTLPHKPNLNKLNELCIKLIEKQHAKTLRIL